MTISKINLDKELESLVERTSEQTEMYERSRRYLYEALAGIYFWWLKASKLKGYLQEKYDEYGIQVNKSNEEKFTGVLRLTWRLDWGGSSRASLQQWSIVLREMHKEYDSNRRAYKNKPQQNMANWIDSKGGIAAITGVKSVVDAYFDINSKNEKNKSGKVKRDADEEALIFQKHKELGEKYFHTSKAIAHIDSMTVDIPLSDKGYAVALVRKGRAGKYDVLATSCDDNSIEKLIVSKYDRNTVASPYFLRVVFDVIKTQSIPVAFNKHRYTLPAATQFTDSEGIKHKHRQNKRLLLSHSFMDILLSENRTDCSVVTVAVPNIDLTALAGDVYLSVNDRRYIEQYIIQRNDLSLYDALPDAKLEVVKNNEFVASHKVKLLNSVLKKERILHFYPLEKADNVGRFQADIVDKLCIEDISVAIDKLTVEKIYANFVNGWLRAYGEKVTQPKHQIIGMRFGANNVYFTYFGENAIHSMKSPKFAYTSVASAKNLSVNLLAKDIMPLLDALPSYSLRGKITIRACTDTVHFSFKTETADFDVYVPTCNEKGKRNNSAFVKYEA